VEGKGLRAVRFLLRLEEGLISTKMKPLRGQMGGEPFERKLSRPGRSKGLFELRLRFSPLNGLVRRAFGSGADSRHGAQEHFSL